jgi:hypothetical protein
MPSYQGTMGNTETEARLRHQRNEAQAQIRRLQAGAGGGADLDRYKERVKAKAIEVAAEQGWCREGLNDALEDLDIGPASRDVQVTLTYEIVVNLDDHEGDDDDAETEAINQVEAVLNRADVVRHYSHQDTDVNEQ